MTMVRLVLHHRQSVRKPRSLMCEGGTAPLTLPRFVVEGLTDRRCNTRNLIFGHPKMVARSPR